MFDNTVVQACKHLHISKSTSRLGQVIIFPSKTENYDVTTIGTYPGQNPEALFFLNLQSDYTF